ncbi:MAG: hypothetical protein KJ607_12015 [Bacteroidetes bacterium]|nr:hypothetical protein [Bacteroidota bacterium]
MNQIFTFFFKINGFEKDGDELTDLDTAFGSSPEFYNIFKMLDRLECEPSDDVTDRILAYANTK